MSTRNHRTVEECEAALATAERNLAEWDARHSGPGEFDHGMLNLSLRSRNGKQGIDGLARRRRELADKVEARRNALAGARRRAAAHALRAAREAAHDSADLKAKFDGCAEVLWTASGTWIRVIRWNKKSVTVNMNGSRESLRHDEIGGAR